MMEDHPTQNSAALYVNNSHWLNSAECRESPNCDERGHFPVNRSQVKAAESSGSIDLIVLHCISLPLGSDSVRVVDDLFLNPLDTTADPSFEDLRDVRVSAHVLIDRAGSIRQYVPFNKRAWHAGVSVWNQRHGCNEFSVGIELLGTDTSPFSDAQYHSLTAVVKALFDYQPRLSMAQVVGHQEVAANRKTDPGTGFDWHRFYATLLGSW